jgi:hypothetical protein
MDYAKPKFPIDRVNRSGRRLIEYMDDPSVTLEDIQEDIAVVENWRASHNHPLNAFYVTLKNRATKINSRALTAQRIKRLSSIAMKLFNADGRKMKLSQMQDIGGCRAVMPTIADVNSLLETYDKYPVIHLRKKENDKNYISKPKSTGYRGIHLKYRYIGKWKSKPWDGLKIEIQLRTLLQHKWATAVEAAGTFTNQALKSNRGSEGWLRFFALMSSVFALREKCALVPGTPDTYENLCNEIRELNLQHHIQAVFAQYHKIIPSLKGAKSAKYFLITLDPIKRETLVKGFKEGESQKANAEYMNLEQAHIKDPTQVVLVQVANVKALGRAYPNYFLDTQDFLLEISNITGVPI